MTIFLSFGRHTPGYALPEVQLARTAGSLVHPHLVHIQVNHHIWLYPPLGSTLSRIRVWPLGVPGDSRRGSARASLAVKSSFMGWVRASASLSCGMAIGEQAGPSSCLADGRLCISRTGHMYQRWPQKMPRNQSPVFSSGRGVRRGCGPFFNNPPSQKPEKVWGPLDHVLV